MSHLVPMNPTTESIPQAETSQVGAYLELTKMRISIMVLLTFAVAALLEALTTGTAIFWSGFGWGMVGMLLVAASGNAMNMYLERYTDFRMPRTAVRPLPTFRLTSNQVAIFAAITLGTGSAILYQLVNWQTAACGLLNWVLYSLVYTPLKRKHWINTEVGAVAGAMPVLMGSLATTGSIGWMGWAFFAVLFFWQFPHFMAIAWKYRNQYRAGGLKMLTVTEPTGVAAGRKAAVTSVLLLAVSLVPAFLSPSRLGSSLLIGAATVLGIYYIMASWSFYRDRNDETARKLMLVSLLYLPLYMVALVVGSVL